WGDDLSNAWTLEQLNDVGVRFLSRLDAASHTYDVSVRMNQNTYKQVLQAHETTGERVLAFSKILFETVGLRIRKVGKVKGTTGEMVSLYGVANLQEAVDFLRWRYHWA